MEYKIKCNDYYCELITYSRKASNGSQYNHEMLDNVATRIYHVIVATKTIDQKELKKKEVEL